MRKIIILAGLTAGALVAALASAPAQAGGKNDWVCWMTPSSIAECAHLPEPYHVRDIPMKPHRHSGKGQPCRHCAVDFTLTHPNIEDLGRYTSNATMRRYHDATLYGSKNRNIHD